GRCDEAEHDQLHDEPGLDEQTPKGHAACRFQTQLFHRPSPRIQTPGTGACGPNRVTFRRRGLLGGKTCFGIQKRASPEGFSSASASQAVKNVRLMPPAAMPVKRLQPAFFTAILV